MPNSAARPKLAKAKKSGAAAPADLPGAFAALRKILEKHAPRLKVVHDTPTKYYLDTPFINKRNKAPLFFGAAIINKNYVSFHLMPIYASSALRAKISAQLKKRMQGKACFNFTWPDAELIAELDLLTSTGIEGFVTYAQTLA